MAARALFSMSGGIAVMPWAFRACSAAFVMTSFSSLPCATKLQVFIPTSEHFSSFAMSGLLRRDVLYLRASSRVGSTESKFREHEPRQASHLHFRQTIWESFEIRARSWRRNLM